jgi:hypothetical protein
MISRPARSGQPVFDQSLGSVCQSEFMTGRYMTALSLTPGGGVNGNDD